MWAHPSDETLGYTSLKYWLDLASLLERGFFDSLFIADILGTYDVYGGGADSAIRHAVEFPVNDPFLLVPAMAAATKNLGFGVTGTLSYEPPYSLARRISTLDHLTEGRFAWNVVTGYLGSAARAFGLRDQRPHNERYAVADEYMDLVYKLWEGSWVEGALVKDKRTGRFADPTKIHKIKHSGRYFSMEGHHLCEPSPQGTPVLFQAGASKSGREFAARHAECVFITGLTPAMAAEAAADIRTQAARFGRKRSDILIFNALCVVTASTDDAARKKVEDYERHVDAERMLTLFSGYSGIDFAGWDLDTPLNHFESNAVQTFVEIFTSADPNRIWTLRELVRFLGLGGFAPIEVGSPETIADRMAHWMNVADLDGFNLVYVTSPADVHSFVEGVVPELQKRGLYKRAYAPGTLREKFFGLGRAKLPSNHPGAIARGVASGPEVVASTAFS
jgi:alkanesulfonate monooxygenase